jgi:hypothetical protein
MNRTHHSLVAAALIVGGFTAAAPAAAADDSWMARAASGVGHYIAAQGNAALIQIREEMHRQIHDQLRGELALNADTYLQNTLSAARSSESIELTSVGQ